ncbi:MAG: PEP-CTERM sorting domain-containing protein [Phycisphaerales bacterium]|nr:PEP-CTERM sorting domain-containing protein [Phycisphaerales bacterium]
MQTRANLWRAVPMLTAIWVNAAANAGLTLLPVGPMQGTHAGNLVVNGSFEQGAPAPGFGNIQFWATGTALLPFAVPGGWSSSGSSQAYAYWGSSETTAPYRTAGSDVLPDGQAGMYFGNATAWVDLPPTFHASREVTFAGSPAFTIGFGQPVRLWQSVPTHLNPAPAYLLSFWVSGEMAGYGAGGPGYDGVFGLRVSNTAATDPVYYFVVPSGGSSLYGASTRYEFVLTPFDSSLPVEIEFINWGHVDLTPHGGLGTTELVIDDVIVNAIPEPSALMLLAVGLVALWRRPRSAVWVLAPARSRNLCRRQPAQVRRR